MFGKQNLNFKKLLLATFLTISVTSVFSVVNSAQEKGKDAKWESAGKQGVATAFSLESKVWLTLQGGSMTEVFYPTADRANVQWLQFVVVNPLTKSVETERDDAKHQIKIVDANSLSFQQISVGKNWEIRKTYALDPQRNSVLIDVEFLPKIRGLELYIFYNPSLRNSGMKDNAWSQDGAFVANEEEIFSALKVSGGFSAMNNGFYGENDGIEDLKQNGKLTKQIGKVENGNVTQLGKIKNPRRFTVVLSFEKTASEALQTASNSLQKGFKAIQKDYQTGWQSYVKTLPKIEAKYQTQFNYAAMVLRASEDKTYRGGNVASLSKPWIQGNKANEAFTSGYHLVWSRDLYQVITAYLAIGDKDSANRALEYLFTKQQLKDGSYPQMTWLDGRVVGDSLQMDEVAYPLILAYQLGRNDRETYLKHIKPTADFIAKIGPTTKQERWEERPGYSPATIAAEIAGLVCAADIAQKNNDESSAKIWLEKADDWAKNVEKWTATSKGKYGDGNYYLRLTKNGTPDAGEKIELNNGAGTFLESEIVDAGFLELVRFGIKSPDDPLIVKSLKVVDEVLKVKTPNGEGFYRYTHDGYGEYLDGRNWNYDGTWTGKGHLWALLSGERGQYELALYNLWKENPPKKKYFMDEAADSLRLKALSESRLLSMSRFANDGMMIPEQIWDKPNGVFPFGEGAGSATPLAWSMAQFIRLAVNIKAGKNLDTPEVVARRYKNLK